MRLAAPVLVACLLAAAIGQACALSGSSGDSASPLTLTYQSSNPLNSASASDSQRGPLRLAFGGTGGMRLDALAFIGGKVTRLADASPSLALTGPSAIGSRSVSAMRPFGSLSTASDEATYYRLGLTRGAVQFQARLMDVGARFAPSAQALQQIDPADAKALQEAAGTQNLDVSIGWKLSRGASLTSQITSLRNDRPGDGNRGRTVSDMNHALALALGPRSAFQATMSEHDETWDPTLGKMNLQRSTGGMEFRTQFGANSGNTMRMAMASTRTKEGGSERSESVREMHLNLAPTSRLQLAADSVAKSSGRGQGQKTDSVAATMKLAPSAQFAAMMKSLTAESGSWSRESEMKFDSTLGHGTSTAQLTAQQKTVRAADPSGSKQMGNVGVNGGIGSGLGRTNLRMAMATERALGPSQATSRNTTAHVDRALGPRLKLSADREARLATGSQRTASVKSSYQAVADLGPRTKLTTQLNTQRMSQGDRQMMRDMVFEHQVRAFRLRSQQQMWREGAVKRAASQYAVDLPSGQVPEWAKDITRGHQFADAHDYMAAKDPAWLDMPFSGFRVWTKRYRGGNDDRVKSVGLAHRTMISDRCHLQVAMQKRPEGEDGELKGRPLPVARKVVEVGTLVTGRLVAHTRYTDDESTSGPFVRRHDIGFGLRGLLSDQEQLEAVVSREISNGLDKASGRTSVTLMYALKASEEQQVSFKGGYAWPTTGAQAPRPEYRWSLGYSKPI